MKKLFIIICFLLTIMTIHAQAKYCDNDADFVGNKWIFFLGPPTKSILVVPYGGGAIGGAIGGAMNGLN